MTTFELRHSWNPFTDPQRLRNDIVPQERPVRRVGRGQNLMTVIFTRIAVDVAAVKILHARLDKFGRFSEPVDSGLNNCLTVKPNVDQFPKHFIRDIVLTLCEEGHCAIVPTSTSRNPNFTEGYNVEELRVGRVTEYATDMVLVNTYNREKGIREDVWYRKDYAAVIENPFFGVMNSSNATLQRLNQKLHLLDTSDARASSGRLDVIIQLPYNVKTELRAQQAEKRRQALESQLNSSSHGVAYTDGVEKVIQLNRPVENTLQTQIQDLNNQMLDQVGLTPAIMNGTADETAMKNYQTRTVAAYLDAITEAMTATFLSKTARTQGQAVIAIDDPFKRIPADKVADIADKFTRNEILTANEVRAILGIRAYPDPKADELRNSNMPADDLAPVKQEGVPDGTEEA